MRDSVSVLQVCTALGIAVTVASAAGPLASAQEAKHVIRDRTGAVACVVTPPASRQGANRLLIDIRVPATPPALLLARLPANKRDYSNLPIRVFLVPRPGESSTKLPQVTPLKGDLTPRVLPESSTEGSFVRVEYAAAHVPAGVDLVAERTAVAASGEKVTTQTRCRIGAVDAIVWR